MSFDILYCPSCSTQKSEDDIFCSSCGFDFSVIKQKKVSKLHEDKFVYYLRIKDRSVFKYRYIHFLDSDYGLLLDFKSRFVMLGHKFEISNSQSKFVYTLRTGSAIFNISIFSVFGELEYSINFSNKTSNFNILDRVGQLIHNYSCYLIHSGSFEVHSNTNSDVISYVKLDNDNPRSIKIVSNYKIKEPIDQIFLTAVYFVLSFSEMFVPPKPTDEVLDLLSQ